MTGTIETMAGLAADGPWAHRANVFAMAEACERAILAPADEGGLPVAVRRALAARMARLNGAPAMAERYAAGVGDEVAALADPGAPAPPDARLAAIVRHVDLVTRQPKAATRRDVDALVAAGLEVADVVRLSQLVAFMNFQIRVVLGLGLVGARP
jgi:uncharacterized protein YciW